MNKFYIFLGNKSGNSLFWRKFYTREIEEYFLGHGIGVKHLDVRQTHGYKYHAFLTLIFKSAEECFDFFGKIRNSVFKYMVVNGEWKIYEYLPKVNRLNYGFMKHDADEQDEEVGNVFEEDDQSREDDQSTAASLSQKSSDKSSESEEGDEHIESEGEEDDESIEPEEEEENEDMDEYEKIYKWLVTPEEEEHRKQIEEIKSLCKWLATPYWERT